MTSRRICGQQDQNYSKRGNRSSVIQGQKTYKLLLASRASWVSFTTGSPIPLSLSGFGYAGIIRGIKASRVLSINHDVLP